jgi:hypothetical protein
MEDMDSGITEKVPGEITNKSCRPSDLLNTFQ